MARRTGEKIGWIGGWIGAFAWVVVLAILFLARGRVLAGAAGLGVAALAMAAAAFFAPWRHPRTPFWKLLLAPYVLVAAAVAWAVIAFGPDALRAEGLSPWSAAILVPMCLPIVIGGRRRWEDGGR